MNRRGTGTGTGSGTGPVRFVYYRFWGDTVRSRRRSRLGTIYKQDSLKLDKMKLLYTESITVAYRWRYVTGYSDVRSDGDAIANLRDVGSPCYLCVRPAMLRM